MRFINVRHISKALEVEVNRIDKSFLQKIKVAIHQYFTENKFIQVSDYKYSLEELTLTFNQLENDKYRVFHEWVAQDFALSNYLISGGKIVQNSSTDINILKKHQLFDEYQQFLSLYLDSILKEHINDLLQSKNWEALRSHLNFCQLIPQSQRAEIQQPINVFIKHQLEQLITPDEVHFQDHFEFTFSTPFILVLNQLDSSFYSTLITYIDTAKLIVNQNKLNAEQLYKIKTCLLQIKLTSKHKEQVDVFCQSEFFQFKNNFTTSVFGWVKSPVFIIGFIVLIFLLILFNWTKEKDPKQQLVKTTSGIDSLTDSELDQVDSLFGFKTDSINKGSDNYQSATPPQFILTADLNGIKNTKAKVLYSSLVEDYQIQNENGLYGNCKVTQKSLFQTSLYSTVQPFPILSSANHTIENKSAIELYVLVFEPENDGEVFGSLIAPGRTLKINLKKGEGVIFYSGQQMNHFNAMRQENNGYGNIDDAKKVNKNFNYHFCLQDIYNFEQLNRIYEVLAMKGSIEFEGLSNGGYKVKSKVLKLR